MGTIGSTIKSLREQAKLSVRELAQEAGIMYSQLSRYENDKSAPNISSLEAICDALKISTSEFLIIAKHELFADPKGRMAHDSLAPLFQKISDILSDLKGDENTVDVTIKEHRESTRYDKLSRKVHYEEIQ